MKVRKRIALAVLLSLLLPVACSRIDDSVHRTVDGKPKINRVNGWKYVFDDRVIPEIHIDVPLENWNALLEAYDRDDHTSETVMCSVLYRKGDEVTALDSVGFRLRGNTSRRRPEEGRGKHRTDKADWKHFHMGLNFRYYVDNDKHTIRGCRKVVLKWFKDDPACVREVFSYDLFRRCGIWTAAKDVYCRLWIHVGGDSRAAYFGVYNLIEPYDASWVKVREDSLAARGSGAPMDGYLWKCRYGSSLTNPGASIGYDGQKDSERPVYELKNNVESFAEARSQLRDFMRKVTDLQGDEFHRWIASHCDVPFLLRTYAVNVLLGNWDDYWNNTNNWYLFFDTPGDSYRFYYLPYDYDNVLGTSNLCGVQTDAGRHSPLEWGSKDNPLIYKILQIPEYRQTYISALKEISSGEFAFSNSVSRINVWWNRISPYVENDTGEDCSLRDRTAGWGNHQEYRLLTGDERTNFFRVKALVCSKL